MYIDEFVKFEEIGLINKSLIIKDFSRMKEIVESTQLKEKVSNKINYDTHKYYDKLPLWAKTLSNLAPDEDVYWFTSDYDDHGAYIGKLKVVLAKIDAIFRLGVDEVTIISKELDTFISFDTYAFEGKFYNEVRFFGRFEQLFINAVKE